MKIFISTVLTYVLNVPSSEENNALGTNDFLKFTLEFASFSKFRVSSQHHTTFELTQTDSSIATFGYVETTLFKLSFEFSKV